VAGDRTPTYEERPMARQNMRPEDVVRIDNSTPRMKTALVLFKKLVDGTTVADFEAAGGRRKDLRWMRKRGYLLQDASRVAESSNDGERSR
jgi:hypothetical protein